MLASLGLLAFAVAIAPAVPVTNDAFDPVPIETPVAEETEPRSTSTVRRFESPDGARIVVSVRNSSGWPNEAALVRLVCDCLYAPLESLTNARGLEWFEALPPGDYVVGVRSERGWATQRVTLEPEIELRISFSFESDTPARILADVQGSAVSCVNGLRGCKCRRDRRAERAERRARRARRRERERQD